MEGFELYFEEFFGLFDSRGVESRFRGVRRIGDRRISVETFHDLFEDLFIVCDPRMDDSICE